MRNIFLAIFLCSSVVSLWSQPQYRTVAEWGQDIRTEMLQQNFAAALKLCRDAQLQYPEEQSFRAYEASVREYLQVENYDITSEEKEKLSAVPTVFEEEQVELTLRQRLVAAAKLDPLLAVHGGVGLHRAGTVDGMTVLNPLSEAVINFYFGPNMGVNLFYYDSHWGLNLEYTSAAQSQIYSLAFGGSLRFRNKFHFLSSRGSLSFIFDIGFGLHDLFPSLLADYRPKLVLLLSFGLSDRPFYHFFGIEDLAGLQVDLRFSLYLSLVPNALSVVRTGNWETVVWQSFGLLRLGLSYRFSISEYYKKQQVFLAQHQFAFLVGIEFRSSFQN